jgi:hypothetical protein
VIMKSVIMNIDLAQAKRFIEILTGAAANAIVTFQTFDDSEEKRGPVTDAEKHEQHDGSSRNRGARR